MTDKELLELKRFKRRANNDLRILEERNRELLSKLKNQAKAIKEKLKLYQLNYSFISWRMIEEAFEDFGIEREKTV